MPRHYLTPRTVPSTPAPAPPNPFAAFLEGDPKVAFFAQQPRFGASPRQQRYFRGQFQDMYDRYLGELGRQAAGGKTPTRKFTDFLQDIDFDWEYGMLSPRQRGVQLGQFAPPVRWFL